MSIILYYKIHDPRRQNFVDPYDLFIIENLSIENVKLSYWPNIYIIKQLKIKILTINIIQDRIKTLSAIYNML